MIGQPGTWRCAAAPIIERVLVETRGRSEKEIRAALREAYPFGERRRWPYKVWCSEVRRQRRLGCAQPRGERLVFPDAKLPARGPSLIETLDANIEIVKHDERSPFMRRKA